MGEKIVARGQAVIWVIVAVVLVASIVLIFYLRVSPTVNKPSTGDTTFDVQSFLQQCTTQYVNEAVDKMLPQGGFIAPTNTLYFNHTNIEYLCENVGFYEPCVYQHPVLLNEMKKEIRKYIYPNINLCLTQMKNNYEQRGAHVTIKSVAVEDISVDFGEDLIKVDISKTITVEKNGQTQKVNNVQLDIQNPLYNLAMIAQEIASQEAKYRYFNSQGYTLLYPRYVVKEYPASGLSKVYTIEDTKSGKIMNIAIRSVAVPAGF